MTSIGSGSVRPSGSTTKGRTRVTHGRRRGMCPPPPTKSCSTGTAFLLRCSLTAQLADSRNVSDLFIIFLFFFALPFLLFFLSLSLSLWWYAQIGEIHTATLLFFRWRMPTKKKLLINPVKNAIPHLCLFNFYRPIHYTEVMLMKCPVQLWKFRFRWKYHHIFLENSKTGIVWMKLQHPFP